MQIIPTPGPEPVVKTFLDGLAGGKPIQTLSVPDARDVLSGVQKAASVTLADVQIKDVTLPLGPTGSTNIRVVRPSGATTSMEARFEATPCSA